MIYLILFLIACICFLIGFLVGSKKEPPIKADKFEKQIDEDLKRLQKEYENFLNYDGSFQE